MRERLERAMSKLSLFTILTIVTVSTVIAATVNKSAVVISPSGKAPEYFSYYGIKTSVYRSGSETPLKPEALKDFDKNLEKSKLLFFMRGTGYTGAHNIFQGEKQINALKKFLSNGGTIFFRYQSLPPGDDSKRFFKAINVHYPDYKTDIKGKLYNAKLDLTSPLFSFPNKIKDGPQGYGWFVKYGDNAKVLASPMGEPNAAAIVEYDNVEGKGRVIISRLFKSYKGKTKAMENFLVSVYGKEIVSQGVGKKLPVFEPYDYKVKPNPLYLSNTRNKPWHLEQLSMRVPIMLTETVGLDRKEYCVAFKAPENAVFGSIDVRSAEGFKIPYQVSNGEIIMQVHLPSNILKVYFIYFNPGEGKGEKNARVGESDAQVKATDKGFLIENDHLKIALAKNSPSFTRFIIRGGSGNNQVAEFGKHMGSLLSNSIRKQKDWKLIKSEIIEKGPLRVSVRYEFDNNRSIVYRMMAGRHLINEEINWNKALSRRVHWAPYGDTDLDTFYYRAAEGIKRFFFARGPLTSPKKAMTEGWYAIEDKRGEAVGEFFELKNTPGFTIYGHGYGLYATTSSRGKGNVRKAFTAIKGDWKDIRREYVNWRNPAIITLGEVQKKFDSSPQVPLLGRNSFRLYYPNPSRYLGHVHDKSEKEIAQMILHQCMGMGANYVALCTYYPFWDTKLYDTETPRYRNFLKPLVKEAHKNGVGIYVNIVHDDSMICPPGLKREECCMIKHRERFEKTYQEIARNNVDGISLSDEGYLAISPEEEKKAFEEKTKFKYEDALKGIKGRTFYINNPATAELALVKMDLFNEHKRAMSKAIREVDKEVIISRLFSPNNHSGISCFDDIDTDSEYFTCASTDLYGTNVGMTKFMTQWVRAIGGNVRERSPINFTGCIYEPDPMWQNQLQHLFSGCVNFIHFAAGFNVAHPRTIYEVTRFYNWLDYTGLGDMLAQAIPEKYMAILWDREAFKESVRRGERSNGTAAPVFYERPIEDIIRLPNTRADILFVRYFTNPKFLNQYKVTVIPSGHVMSEGVTKTVKEYTTLGGTVIISGNSLMESGIQQLTGVEVEKTLKRLNVEPIGENGYESFVSEKFPADILTAKIKDAKIILKDKSTEAPVAAVKQVGKGKIISVFAINGYAQLVPDMAKYLTGFTPMELKGKGAKDVYWNIFQGKGYRIAALCNTSAIDTAEISVEISPEPKPGTKIIDFWTGKTDDWKKPFNIKILQRDVKFLYIADEKNLDIPKSKTLDANSGAAATTGGMEFLKQESEEGAADIEKEPGKIYVGVFVGEGEKRGRKFEKGSKTIIETLTGKPDLKITPLKSLKYAAIKHCDAIIVPNMGHPGTPLNLNKDWIESIRKYVTYGGGVMLCHHAIGTDKLGGTVFPSLGEIGKFVEIQDMKALSSHPVITGDSIAKKYARYVNDPAFADEYTASFMKKGDSFRSSFVDYMRIEPGKGTEIIAKSVYDTAKKQGDDAILVAGKFGKGKVLLCGISIGCKVFKNKQDKWQEESYITPGEKKIVTNAIYWLTEK